MFTLLALTTIFILVENSHGLNEWELCKHELEARGEQIDWKYFVPPPIDAASNIYAAPKMKEWFVREPNGNRTNELLLHLQNTNTITILTTTNQASDYLDVTDDYASDFEIIRSGLQRPFARIDSDYSKPFQIATPNFVVLRTLAQTLAQRARCDFLLGQPDEALREVTLMHHTSRLLDTKPTGKPFLLITAMINVAITGLYTDVITEGLNAHAWREPELKTLAAQLEEINLLPLLPASLRAERAAACHTLESSEPGTLMSGMGRGSTSLSDFFKDPVPVLMAHMPRSLIYQNMAFIARAEQTIIDANELSPGKLSPAKWKAAALDLENRVFADSKFSPSKWFAATWIPNYTRAGQTTARNQTKVNQARIVCALELYRLARGEYPEKAESLAPQFIAQIPHDLIGGKPLHYQRLPDGKFLLYSIGWNETDDGGVSGKSSDNGDWVWGEVTR